MSALLSSIVFSISKICTCLPRPYPFLPLALRDLRALSSELGTLRRHKLRIARFRASTKAHSLRCASSSHKIFDFAGNLFIACFPTRSIFSCGGMKLWVQFSFFFAAHLNCQRRLLPHRFPKKTLDFSCTLCQTCFNNRSLSNLTYKDVQELSVDSYSNRFVQACQGHIL